MHTQPGYPMGYVHSLGTRWTKHTQILDRMDYTHTAWRSYGLSTHGLKIRWTMHPQYRDPMD